MALNPVSGLALGRVAIGVGAIASPGLAMKMFRLDTETNPQLAYMSRMFGSREIALGALTLATSGKTQRNLILAGIAVDAADAAAGQLAAREGTVSKTTGTFLTLPALGAVAAGIAGLVLGRR
jgi:glycerol kinase